MSQRTLSARELEHAHARGTRARTAGRRQPDAHAAQVVAARPPLGELVRHAGSRAGSTRVERAPAAGPAAARRAARSAVAAQVEVRPRSRARTPCPRSPSCPACPTTSGCGGRSRSSAARATSSAAPRLRSRRRRVAHGALLQREVLARSRARVGQNQAVSATATGIVPHTTAHGVKIEPMNSIVVASARDERPEASASGTHRGGPACASSTVRDQHLAARRPRGPRTCVGIAAGGSHSGSRPCTTGIGCEVARRRRRGGRPFERAARPTDSAPASAPRRAAAHRR